MPDLAIYIEGIEQLSRRLVIRDADGQEQGRVLVSIMAGYLEVAVDTCRNAAVVDVDDQILYDEPEQDEDEDNIMTERPCENCGDEVLTLSSRDWCDGCEADIPTLTIENI